MAYTWATFKAAVKALASDGEISNDTAVAVIADYVRARIALTVDKNAPLAAGYAEAFMQQKDRLLGFSVTLSDPDLRTAVNKYLAGEFNRGGISEPDGFIDQHMRQAKREIAGAGTWIDNQIRQGVIELEHFIPYYQTGQETNVAVGDITVIGEACEGTLPEGCQPREAYYVKDDFPCTRMPIVQYDWQNRFDLRCGAPKVTGAEFYMAVAPDGSRKFWLFPTLLEGHKLQLFWDGTKISFADGDTVTFDEPAVEAIAAYLLWKMNLRPNASRPAIAKAHKEVWEQKRLICFRGAQAKTRLRYTNSSPAASAPSGGCDSCAVNEEEA